MDGIEGVGRKKQRRPERGSTEMATPVSAVFVRGEGWTALWKAKNPAGGDARAGLERTEFWLTANLH